MLTETCQRIPDDVQSTEADCNGTNAARFWSATTAGTHSIVYFN